MDEGRKGIHVALHDGRAWTSGRASESSSFCRVRETRESKDFLKKRIQSQIPKREWANGETLSKDLGAFSGFLFDIGVKKILVGDEGTLSEKEQLKIERILKKRHKEVIGEKEEEDLHTEMQYHLLRIGDSLGYDSGVRTPLSSLTP